MPRQYTQDPDENLDYGIDYSGRIPSGDSIIDSVWEVPDGLTGSDESVSDRTAIIFLTGGEDGVDYVVGNRSTTAAGRVVEDYITLQIRANSF